MSFGHGCDDCANATLPDVRDADGELDLEAWGRWGLCEERGMIVDMRGPKCGDWAERRNG